MKYVLIVMGMAAQPPEGDSDRSCPHCIQQSWLMLASPALTALKTQEEFKGAFYSFLHSVLRVDDTENHSGFYLCYTAHLECVELGAGGKGSSVSSGILW